MTQFLPSNLLALFAPRDPIPYLPPVDKLPYEKQTAGYTGISAFLHNFEDPSQTPAPITIETREERQERKRKSKAEATAYKLETDIAVWAPTKNPTATTDPFKTLFVARVSYDTTESKLRRAFEIYGPIKKVAMVHDEKGKPRGYAFIEYERARDMHSAYKHADGNKIDGRRVLVDVERGRTVKGWLPRRLGGGLGGTRRGGPEVNVKHSGREETKPEDRERFGGGGGVGKDRAVDRERERPDREPREPRRRSRSRSRERRRRSGSRGRNDRHRAERHKRNRSRDRERNRDRDAGANDRPDGSTEVSQDGIQEGEQPTPRKERRRSRSRDRDHKRRRSRSRERRRRDREDRGGDRESDREKRDGSAPNLDIKEEPMDPLIDKIKEEPLDPEPDNQEDMNNQGYEGDFNNYNNNGETNDYGEY